MRNVILVILKLYKKIVLLSGGVIIVRANLLALEC